MHIRGPGRNSATSITIHYDPSDPKTLRMFTSLLRNHASVEPLACFIDDESINSQGQYG